MIKHDEKNNYDSKDIIFHFKTNKIIRKDKSKEKNDNVKKYLKIKRKEKKNIKENEILDSNQSILYKSSLSKSKDNKSDKKRISKDHDKYKHVKNRNIIDILSSKQSTKISNLNQTTANNSKKNVKTQNNSINNLLKENLYGKLNSTSTYSLLNKEYKKEIRSNKSSKNKSNNKKNISINSYLYNSKLKKDKKIQKKWENNLLNLTTKETNETYLNYNNNSKNNIIKKKLFDDSFQSNSISNDSIYNKKNYNAHLNTINNSIQNIWKKSKYIKFNSTESSLNKNKYKKYQNLKIKENQNNSMTNIFSNINPHFGFKSNNISYSILKNNLKINRLIKKSVKNLRIENIRNYFGPIDISLISIKNKEESKDDIIRKMIKNGFKCKIINNNLIKCYEKRRILNIEIVKIRGNLLYYFIKNKY